MCTIMGSSGRGCGLIISFQLYGCTAGHFESNLFWVGQYEILPQPSYWKNNYSNINDFIQFLSNLSKIMSSQKSECDDVIRFFVAKGKKFRKIDKNGSRSYLLKDLMNFYKIFGKM